MTDRTPTPRDATIISHSFAGPKHGLRRTVSYASSAQTLVQPTLRDKFPQLTTSEEVRELLDADGLLPKEVSKVITMQCLHATIKGVRASRVLVLTEFSTARLLRIVEFQALIRRDRIARQVRKVVGDYGYGTAEALQRDGTIFPFPFWVGHKLRDIIPSKADCELLEAGADLNLLEHKDLLLTLSF